jgi:hypothetical protein
MVLAGLKRSMRFSLGHYAIQTDPPHSFSGGRNVVLKGWHELVNAALSGLLAILEQDLQLNRRNATERPVIDPVWVKCE